VKIYFARHGFHIPTETFMRKHRVRRLVSFVDDQLPLIVKYHQGPDRPPGKRTAKPGQKKEETTWLL
jgi:hypothetical protein